MGRAALPVLHDIMKKCAKQLFSRNNQRHFVIHEWLRCRGVISRVIYRTGLERRYIEKWVNRYRSTGTVNDSPRSGRPRVLNSPQVTKLVKAVEERDSVAAAVAAQRKKGTIPRSVSVKTVRRAVKPYLERKNQRVKPVLTPRTRQKRLVFSQRQHKYLKRLVAVDSKYLKGCFGPKHKVWVKRGTTRIVEKPRKGPQVHVYGGITRYGATKLIRATGTTGLAPRFIRPGGVRKYSGVCAKEFQQILQKHLVPEAKRLLRGKKNPNPVFLLDGAPPHTAASTRRFMRAQRIQYVKDWPPNSPDLNPIENVWAWLQQQVAAQEPSSGAAIWRVAQQVWETLTPDMCSSSMCSFTDRLQACASNDGGHTDY